MRSALLVLGLLLSWASAQAQIFGTSPARRIRSGTSLPATCTVSDIFFKTDATAGQNVYGCTATDTWMLQGGGTGVVSSGSEGCLAFYPAAGTTVDDIQSTVCRIEWDATEHRLIFNDSAGAETFHIDADDGSMTVTSALAWVQTSLNVVSASGNDTYAGTVAASFTAYPTGNNTALLVLDADTANTGAATLNLTPSGGAALGAKPIYKYVDGTDLADNDVRANQPAYLIWDAGANSGNGAWFLIGPIGNAPQPLDSDLTAVAGGNPDFSGMTTTKPVKTGTSAPATCAVGELFYDTDATAGQNTYGCTATNTWTLQGDGGGSSLPSQTNNAGKLLTTNGTDAAWALETDKTRWIARMWENWMRSGGELGWTQDGTSGYAQDSGGTTGTFQHPGVRSYYTVYAAAEKYTVLYNLLVGALGSNAKWESYFTFKSDPYASTEIAYRFGFVKSGQAGANPPTDGIWMRFWNSTACTNNATDSYWTYESRAASTSTTQASAVAYTADTYYTVRMRSTTSGTIAFAISTDDGATFSSDTNISTNVPTDSLLPFMQVYRCAASSYGYIKPDEFRYEAWR